MNPTVRERYAGHALRLENEPDGTPPTLGLGDVVELAGLQPDETVLDLGSGPGRDLLAAARIAARAVGVDMTPEMIERARAAAAGFSNVSILEGDLEQLPVHCGAVDVVISNCVINLVDDKRRALIEAYRVLAPGGRFAVLDTAFETEPGPDARAEMDVCSCVGGALVADDYAAMLRDIGYEDVRVDFLDGDSCAPTVRSVAVTARKPGAVEDGVRYRPAIASDRAAIEALVADAPAIEDAIVALDDGRVVGVVALERSGKRTLLRSLAVDPDRRGEQIGTRLVYSALDVARWSGALDVYLFTESAGGFFERFSFVPVSKKRAEKAVGASPCPSAMVLRFEDADLPLLGKPSVKPLPVFDGGRCC